MRVASGVGRLRCERIDRRGHRPLRRLSRAGQNRRSARSSGVGKSSFVNALAGEELMAVNTIREDDSKGRHTTTHRQLIRLNSGVMIIDTPGMRELGMLDAAEGLSETFSDVEQYFGMCRFSNCRHESEPGLRPCRRQSPPANCRLSAYQSYQKLRRESAYAEDSAGYLRAKHQRFLRDRKKNAFTGKSRRQSAAPPERGE